MVEDIVETENPTKRGLEPVLLEIKPTECTDFFITVE
jgi:hypothetical protein